VGLFFRKSIKVGPFRINLSKSGVGLSGGVKGACISTGPRGTELHLGRKGVYYRKKLGGISQGRQTSSDAQTTSFYPQVDLRNSVYLTYQSGYADVVRTIGLPDNQITTGPPDAKIPNTVLYYRGHGTVFMVYDPNGAWWDLSNAHYIGTKTFNPPQVLHTSIDDFRPLLTAYNLAPEMNVSQYSASASETHFAPQKRRWPIYVGLFLAVGAIGTIIENNSKKSPPAQTPIVQATPSPSSSPTPRMAKRQRAQRQPQTSSVTNPDPVVVSEAAKQERITQPAPAVSTVSSAGSVRPHSSSGSGRSYIMGPRGGCYYISGSGSKVYVDHSYCN
jgi:hypothetical protein